MKEVNKMIKNKRFWTETEMLCQQLELLAEDSKEDFPETCKVSRNSTAMAKISNELFKRKCFALMFFIALYYFFIRFTIKRK